MMGFNKALLFGEICEEPELRQTKAGRDVLNLRLLTIEKFNVNGEPRERLDYHRVVVWGERGAELSRSLTKGSHAIVEGSIRYSSYEKDGQKRTATEINAREVIPVAPAAKAIAAPEQDQPQTGGGFDHDDIPF
jgi:single-strand DNA-binding protein